MYLLPQIKIKTQAEKQEIEPRPEPNFPKKFVIILELFTRI